MLKIRLTIITAAWLFWSASLAYTQSAPEALDLIKKVSETYKGLDTYQFEGVTSTEIKAQGMEMKMEFPFLMAVRKPDKMRWESKNPTMGILMVADGQDTWMYLAAMNKYTRMPGSFITDPGMSLGMTGSSISGYETIAEQIKQAKILREEALKIEGKEVPCFVVELEWNALAPSPDRDARSKTLWIDKQRFIVLKDAARETTEKILKSGETKQRTNVVFTSLKLNEPVPDALFVFTPPKGAKEVKDMMSLAKPPDLVGKEAEDFTLNGLDGEAYNLKSLRGRVVLLFVWSSEWANKSDLATLEKLSREFKSQGLVVLGVNARDRAETAREFLGKTEATFPMLLDPDNNVADGYSHMPNLLPATVVINREGKIVLHSMMFNESEVRSALKNAGIE